MSVVLVVIVTAAVVATVTVVVATGGDRVRQPLRRRAERLRRRLADGYARLERRFGRGGGLSAWLGGNLLVLFGLTVLAGLALQATSPQGGPAFDRHVTEYFAASRSPVLTTTMQVLSDVGDTITMGIVGIVTGLVWRWRRGTWRGFAVLATAYLGALALYNTAKPVVARPRPAIELAVQEVAGQAFPSGHVTGSSSFYAALALLVATLGLTWALKVAIVGGASLAIALIAMSRLYLGAHWVTDVVWGAALGSLWALVTMAPLWAVAREEGRTDDARLPAMR